MDLKLNAKLLSRSLELRYTKQPELLEIKKKLLLRQVDYYSIVNQEERDLNNQLLNPDEKERWDRQIRNPLIFQKRIRDSKIAVFGCGGIGTTVLNGLIYSGVYNFKIIDFDTIELSNLNRQIFYIPEDLGQNKVETTKKRLLEINPNANVESYILKIDYPLDLDVFKLKDKDYPEFIQKVDDIIKWADIIVSTMDYLGAPYLINDLCIKNKKPFYWGGVNLLLGEIYSYKPKDRTPCIRCIYGASNLLDKTQFYRYRTRSDLTPICANIGSTVIITGSLISELIIHHLCDIPNSFNGNFIIFDGYNFELIKTPIKTDKECSCQK